MDANAHGAKEERCHNENVQASGLGGLSFYPLFLLACNGKIENTPAICAEYSAIAVSEKNGWLCFTTLVLQVD